MSFLSNRVAFEKTIDENPPTMDMNSPTFARQNFTTARKIQRRRHILPRKTRRLLDANVGPPGYVQNSEEQ
jgi:hypothetical protein